MLNPKPLVGKLHQSWELVERLVQISAETPQFQEAELLQFSQRIYPDIGSYDVLNSLVGAGIVERFEGTEYFQLNAHVLAFVRALTHEQQLGLTDVLKARIGSVATSTESILAGIESNDSEAIRKSANKLSETFREIRTQLVQDRQAIGNLVQKAKASDANLPLAKRYEQVLQAYDEYVEPINELLDSTGSGAFYSKFQEAIFALEKAYQHLRVAYGVSRQIGMIENITRDARQLLQFGLSTAKDSSSQLWPLKEEARQSTKLSAAISLVLGEIGKKGIRRALPAVLTGEPALPTTSSEQHDRLIVDDRVLGIMADMQSFEPQVHVLTEEMPDVPELALVTPINEQDAWELLVGELPQADLFKWIVTTYPLITYQDRQLLQLYHRLSSRDELTKCFVDFTQTTELCDLIVKYHPLHVKLEQDQTVTEEAIHDTSFVG